MIKAKLIGLRALENEDLVHLRDWRNLTDFRKHFREVRELSIKDQENWMTHLNQTRDKNFMFGIVRLRDGKLIGACGLLYVNWVIRSADFSFYIGENEEYIDNNGWANEATQLLLEYGFNNLNLNKIWMELYEFDQKKIQFFTKEFKFVQDGILRDNCFEDGRYWNSVLISLLRSEFN
jgi:RimJ/RimL family protein N-acetyltransferase